MSPATPNNHSQHHYHTKMEDDAWAESLDLDDPVSSPILRPCTNRPLPTPTQLHPSTSQPQTLNNNPRNPKPSQQNAQTLADSQPSPPFPVQPRSIPGPAGAVLAALRRRRSQILDRDGSEEDMPVVSTQECLRKAVDCNGGNSEFDDDFKKPCWIAALDFADGGDGELASSAAVPLGAVRKWRAPKLPKVVAMIKSLTPNGFGDFMVVLKDPSGTISGSIHKSVVTEGSYGCYLSVGAVMVLQKVSVFAPRVESYLNITHPNVVKIFPKDFESLSNIDSGLTAVADCGGSVVKSPMVQKSVHAGIQLNNRGTTNEVGGAISYFGRRTMSERLQGNSSTKETNEPKGDITIRNSSTDTNNKSQVAFRGSNSQFSLPHEQSGEASKMIHKASTTAADSNGANKPIQPLTSLSSLPRWTDEQLEELLMED